MLLNLPNIALLAMAFGAGVDALGINCRGSSNCGNGDLGSLQGVRDQVSKLKDQGHGKRHYNQGQQIACSNNLCAFFQNLPGGENVEVALDKIDDLLGHKCKRCGSCPTKPGNNVATGELTVNWVSHPCCSSTVGCICPY